MKLFNEFREFVSAVKRLAHAESERANADRYLGDSILVLAQVLSSRSSNVSRIRITQIQGENTHMPIVGVKVGTSGTFTATLLDASSNVIATLPAGATLGAWSSSDTTNTTGTPSADGLSIVVVVASNDPNPSFNLAISGTNADGSAFSGTATVPVLPATPPPTNVASIRIDQTA